VIGEEDAEWYVLAMESLPVSFIEIEWTWTDEQWNLYIRERLKMGKERRWAEAKARAAARGVVLVSDDEIAGKG